MIYLFGHKGFVGSGIADYFIKNNIEFTHIDRDNYSSFKGTKCSIFINAAGSSKKLLASKEPVLDFEKNFISTFNTLFDFRYDKYVYLSTIDVYDDFININNNSEEHEIFEGNLSNYGFNKYLAEKVVRKYADKWLILRLGGMVGVNLKKNVVFDLLTNKNLYVHPESEYQYINTSEVAEIIVKLSKFDNEIFNICGDGVITPKEIADKLGIELNPEFYNLRRDKYVINIDKLKRYHKVSKTKETVFEFIIK